LSKWLLAFYMLTASKNGVAAWEIHRTLAVTQKTAWFMMHRIREAMKVTNPELFTKHDRGRGRDLHRWQSPQDERQAPSQDAHG
jgi:hypothetical protein